MASRFDHPALAALPPELRTPCPRCQGRGTATPEADCLPCVGTGLLLPVDLRDELGSVIIGAVVLDDYACSDGGAEEMLNEAAHRAVEYLLDFLVANAAPLDADSPVPAEPTAG